MIANETSVDCLSGGYSRLGRLIHSFIPSWKVIGIDNLKGTNSDQMGNVDAAQVVGVVGDEEAPAGFISPHDDDDDDCTVEHSEITENRSIVLLLLEHH